MFLSNFMISKRKRHSGVRKYALLANRMMRVLAFMAAYGGGAERARPNRRMI